MLTESDEYRRMSYLIAEHLQMLEKEGASPLTIRSRRRCLRRLHDDLDFGIAAACTEQLQEWLGYHRWSPATRYTYTGHVKAFTAWLVAIGYLDDDPAASIRRPHVPPGPVRWASDEQLAVALAAPEPLLTAVILAAYDGLRRSECAHSRREHITEATLLIPRAKGGKPQTVPTHPIVWAHVRDRPPGPLVPGRDGDEIDPEQLSRMVMRYFRGHDMPGFGLHHLRRRLGVVIQREHRDIRVTQRLLRHVSIATTQIYTDPSDDQVREALSLLRWVDHRPVGPGPVTQPEA